MNKIDYRKLSIEELLEIPGYKRIISNTLKQLESLSDDKPKGIIGTTRKVLKKDGTFSYATQVYMGIKNGKKVYRSVKSSTLKESQRRAFELLQLKDEGEIPTSRNERQMTFGELLESFLVNYNRIAETTREGYRQKLNPHILYPKRNRPDLKDLRLRQLQPDHFELLYSAMASDGKSPSTIETLHIILGVAFKWGIQRKLLSSDPRGYVTAPTGSPVEMKTLDRFQSARLLLFAKGNPVEMFINMALYTGARRSELRGLTWKDIDFTTGDVHIRRALVNPTRQWVIKEPKTKQSKRVIPLGKNHDILSMLKRFKHEQEQKLAVRGKKVDPNDRIFTRPQDDEPWTMEFIQTHFKKAIQSAELPNIRLHDLRHTFATLLLQHYLPQKVQRLMGHSSIQTTIDIYGHAIPGDSLELTQGFDEAIKDALEQVSERELQLI